MISLAYAQTATAATPQSTFMSFIPMILIFFVVYFLMLRPQKKQREKEMEFIAALKKGQEVFTKSGMIGTIHGLTDKVVTLDVGQGNLVKFLRSQIQGSTEALKEPKPAKK